MKNGTCECNLVIYGIIRWLVSLAWTIGSRAQTESKASQQGARHIAPIRKVGRVSPPSQPRTAGGASEHHNGISKPTIHCTLLAQNSYKQPGNYILAPTLNFSIRKVHSGQQKRFSRPPQQMCLILNWEIGILVSTPVSLGLVSAKAHPGVTALLLGCWQDPLPARSTATESNAVSTNQTFSQKQSCSISPHQTSNALHLDWRVAAEANCRSCLHTV